MRARHVAMFLAFLACAAVAPPLPAQSDPPFASETEIPLQHCDLLPVVTLKVADADMRFVVDTAATTMLNIQSVASGRAKKIQITSWSGTAVAHGREVLVPELSLANHSLRNLKLEAVDLSAIAKACGGTVDGILGVDLLEKLGVTLDLKSSVARMGSVAGGAETSIISEMESSMRSCSEAFNDADADRLAQCFDADFVWSTPSGEFHGRDEASLYLRDHLFRAVPHGRFSMKINDQRAVGNVVWTLYDFSLDSPSAHRSGRGMMICRKSGDHWYILSMHETLNPGSRGLARDH
jgi:ketosteroid isomerase-like protein